jgi:hypothetical protein
MAASASGALAMPSLGPPAGESSSAPAPLKAATGFSPDTESTTGTLEPQHALALWPWLLAAVALGAGGAFLFFRNRSRAAFAGGPQVDAFVAPEAAPAPLPRAPEPAPPVPPRAAPPAPSSVVSTRLRPWLDLSVVPIRCIVEESQAIIDFELELYNSGNAPARGVLVEASLFNASPTQDQDIGAFFAKADRQGDRIDMVPPLQRLSLRAQVAAPLHNLQVLEIARRQLFVPLIAFNAFYQSGSTEGQTSLAYLLGRDTKGEKMAPFRLDLGPRVFRNLGARQLPTQVRR